MAALTFDGTVMKPVTFTRLPNERGGGGLRRSVNGQLRGASDWSKRAWTADLVAVDDTELNTVLSFVSASSVSVAGDLVAATVPCRIERGDVETVRELGDWYYTVPVTMREI